MKTNCVWTLKRTCCRTSTYNVPTTRLVFPLVSLSVKILAMPKSDIFGFMSLSNRILLVFKSRWMILNLEYLWRYRRPWAIPSMMCMRLLQSKIDRLVESAPICNIKKIKIGKRIYKINLFMKHIYRTRQKLTNQKWKNPGFCLACTHKSVYFLLLQCSIPKA